SRSVVDAVSDEYHVPATRLNLFYSIRLLLGKHVGADVLDAQLECNSFGRGPVVTRNHRKLVPHLSQGVDGCERRFLDGIGDAEHGDRLPADSHEHGRLALLSN